MAILAGDSRRCHREPGSTSRPKDREMRNAIKRVCFLVETVERKESLTDSPRNLSIRSSRELRGHWKNSKERDPRLMPLALQPSHKSVAPAKGNIILDRDISPDEARPGGFSEPIGFTKRSIQKPQPPKSKNSQVKRRFENGELSDDPESMTIKVAFSRCPLFRTF